MVHEFEYDSSVVSARISCTVCDYHDIILYDPPLSYLEHHRLGLEKKCPECQSPCLVLPARGAATNPLEKNISLRKVTEEDIDFVLKTLYKKAPHDKTPIKALFYGMNTVFTKRGMPHNVNSPVAGAGKNYLLNLVASVFPQKYIEQFLGVSDKAFLHKRGVMVVKNEESGKLESAELIITNLEEQISEIQTILTNLKKKDKAAIKENQSKIAEIEKQIKTIKRRQQKLIIFDDLVIIFSDTPTEGFMAQLMSMTGQDSIKEYQEYLFTDKKASGELDSRANILKGMPVIFSTQVIDDTNNKRFGEKNRRVIPITPSTTNEKINDAIALMGNEAGLLPEEYDQEVTSEADLKGAKEIVALVVEKLRVHTKSLEGLEYGVHIPFQKAIAHSIPGQGVWRMTVMKRLMGYLAIITKVRMDSRPRMVNRKTGAFYPISTFKDLKEAYELIESGGSNVKAYLAKCYNEVIVPAYTDLPDEPAQDPDTFVRETHRGLTTLQIAEAMRSKLGVGIGTTQVRASYLYPLVNCGLLDYERSNIKRSENIWFPVDAASSAFSMFGSEDNRKLIINDIDIYPSLNYIEEYYRNWKKHDAEGGKENKNEYILQDENGIEISSSELVDKYFRNPGIESVFDLQESEKRNESEK